MSHPRPVFLINASPLSTKSPSLNIPTKTPISPIFIHADEHIALSHQGRYYPITSSGHIGSLPPPSPPPPPATNSPPREHLASATSDPLVKSPVYIYAKMKQCMGMNSEVIRTSLSITNQVKLNKVDYLMNSRKCLFLNHILDAALKISHILILHIRCACSAGLKKFNDMVKVSSSSSRSFSSPPFGSKNVSVLLTMLGT